MARLVELFPESERFHGVTTEAGGEQIVEKVAHGGVGIVGFERNFGTLHRKSLPTVGLNSHDKCGGDQHRHYPRNHVKIPVVDDIAKGYFMKNISETTHTDE